MVGSSVSMNTRTRWIVYAGYHVKMLDAAPILKDNNNEYLLKEVLVLEADSGTLLMHHIIKPLFDRDFL